MAYPKHAFQITQPTAPPVFSMRPLRRLSTASTPPTLAMMTPECTSSPLRQHSATLSWQSRWHVSPTITHRTLLRNGVCSRIGASRAPTPDAGISKRAARCDQNLRRRRVRRIRSLPLYAAAALLLRTPMCGQEISSDATVLPSLSTLPRPGRRLKL